MTGPRDQYGRWDGEVEVRRFDDEAAYNTSKVNYKNGIRHGKETWYDDSGSIINEFCYDIGRRVKCPDPSKQAGDTSASVAMGPSTTASSASYTYLAYESPGFLLSLEDEGFDSTHVQAFLAAIEQHIREASPANEEELASAFDAATTSVSEEHELYTAYRFYAEIEGMQRMKSLELRMAAIDRHREPGSATFDILEEDYPTYFSELGVSATNEQIESFSDDLDSRMDLEVPLDPGDPLLPDSVDARLFRNLGAMFVEGVHEEVTGAVILDATGVGFEADPVYRAVKAAFFASPAISPRSDSRHAAGHEFWVEITVGDASLPVSDLFGVSFVLNYSNTEFIDVVTPHASNVQAGSFLGSDPVFVQVVDETNGTVSIGLSRKAGEGSVSGEGGVARVKFVAAAGTPDDTQVTFSISDVTANDDAGGSLSLTAGASTVTIDSGVELPPTLSVHVDGSINSGDEFKMDIHAADVTNLLGISFEMHYAPATLLEILDVEGGSFMGSDVVFLPNIDGASGKVSVGISRKAEQGGVDGSGVVATVRMRLSDDALSGDIINVSLENVNANDASGNSIEFQTENSRIVTSIDEGHDAGVPREFDLHSNYPNPFNPETHFQYDVPEAALVRIEIVNLLGQRVVTLVDERKPAGSYSITWNGRDEGGSQVASGTYIYRLSSERLQKSRAMVLMK